MRQVRESAAICGHLRPSVSVCVPAPDRSPGLSAGRSLVERSKTRMAGDGRRHRSRTSLTKREKSPGGAGVSAGVSAEPTLGGQKGGRVDVVLFNNEVGGAPVRAFRGLGACLQSGRSMTVLLSFCPRLYQAALIETDQRPSGAGRVSPKPLLASPGLRPACGVVCPSGCTAALAEAERARSHGSQP